MITRCCRRTVARPDRGLATSGTGVPGGHPAAGLLLAGRYRLAQQVGRGATSTVWRAWDERLDRTVAIKQITTGPPTATVSRARDGSARRDGVAEARIAAQVRHPNVAVVHDVVEDGRSCWLVMDYFTAATLATMLRLQGALPPSTVAALGLQLLAALRAVHRAGVVHCDVKPANLLVCGDGLLVLIDFGIAVGAGTDPIGRVGGDIVGSPAYMAPELVRGECPSPAADLWSLGATLYAATEGRPPFPHGDPAPTLAAVLLDPPTPPVLAGPLRPLLDQLLVKDPTHRPSHDTIHSLLSAACLTMPTRTLPHGPTPAADTPSTVDNTQAMVPSDVVAQRSR